ncbi:hypothetical protein AOLI_G00311150 [Acnodon oligacanthus]
MLAQLAGNDQPILTQDCELRANQTVEKAGLVAIWVGKQTAPHCVLRSIAIGCSPESRGSSDINDRWARGSVSSCGEVAAVLSPEEDASPSLRSAPRTSALDGDKRNTALLSVDSHEWKWTKAMMAGHNHQRDSSTTEVLQKINSLTSA